MIHIYLLCVGKLKEKFYADAVAEYQKRLSSYCKLDIIELAEEKLPQGPSQALIDAALAKEAAAIRAKLPPKARTVACASRDSFSPAGSFPSVCGPGRRGRPTSCAFSSAAPTAWTNS